MEEEALDIVSVAGYQLNTYTEGGSREQIAKEALELVSAAGINMACWITLFHNPCTWMG